MKQAFWFPKVILLAIFCLAPPPLSWTQQRQPPGRTPPFPAEEPSRGPFPSLSRRMLRASYEQLQKDTDQLVKLANALKEEVSKANEDVLPLSGVKKAEEIEKLAKKIQGRMKNL